jgi:diguanylate cyclase (GGDEF)-like protein
MNFAIFAAEAGVVAVLILGLFSVKSRLGLAPLFTAIGALQYVQVVLAATASVQVLPGVWSNPGSAVLFPASLMAVLLIYIREDAAAARQLIYGLLAANLTASLVLVIVGLQSVAVPPGLPEVHPLFLLMTARMLMSGSLFLWLDVVLLILTFEIVSRALPAGVFPRAFISLAAVLTLDSALFVAFNFGTGAGAIVMLEASVLSKAIASAIYAAALALYLRATRTTEFANPRQAMPIKDVFQLLTYRQRFEALRESTLRDPLTGAYNRRFLDDFLPDELARAHRLGLELSVLMIDVDRFKRVNDTYGHPEGDRVLSYLAGTLTSTARDTDAVVRYGGEEFCVVAPGTSLAQAGALAERVRVNLAALCAETRPPLGGGEITLTIGVASFPDEADTVAQLISRADRRLLRGKRDGRDRVVTEDA